MARAGSWEAWGDGMRRLVEGGQTFQAYTPPLPPAGSYDPALDAQRAAAGRGLLDLTQDVGTANTRGIVDYGLQRDDITRARARGTDDIGTRRRQTQEDYDRNVQMLEQSYSRLGNRQGQQMRAAGVSSGGAVLQAAAKRKANMADDKFGMDRSRSRAMESFDLAGRRLNEDSDLAFGRLSLNSAPPDASNPFGGRDFQDRTTQLTRAQREASSFGLDLDAQRLYQAAASGWVPDDRWSR